MEDEVYIIIVNYLGWEDTIECLESVLKLNYTNFQVIVIDNSDSDDDISNLKNWAIGNEIFNISTNFTKLVYPLELKPIDYLCIKEEDFLNHSIDNKLLFVKASKNRGFAAANNIALKYVLKFGKSEDKIWLLNNDTVISKDSLNVILEGLKKNYENIHLTLFGTPLLEYYFPSKVQAIGGRYNKFIGLTSHVGESVILKEQIDISKFIIDYPIGASMIITNGFLKNVGFLNEEYFLFYEELDWAMRAKAKMGDVKILNAFDVYHKQGNSTKTKSSKLKSKNEFIDILSIKNRILFSRKYYKQYTWVVIVFILTVTLPKRLFFGDLKRAIKICKKIFEKN